MQWETATPVGFPVCMRHKDCTLKTTAECKVQMSGRTRNSRRSAHACGVRGWVCLTAVFIGAAAWGGSHVAVGGAKI